MMKKQGGVDTGLCSRGLGCGVWGLGQVQRVVWVVDVRQSIRRCRRICGWVVQLVDTHHGQRAVVENGWRCGHHGGLTWSRVKGSLVGQWVHLRARQSKLVEGWWPVHVVENEFSFWEVLLVDGFANYAAE